jgi:predicted nucleotidyltransferase component of viral defense system
MPSYNKQILSKQAQELGFIRDTFEKMVRLAEMLSFISKDPLLSKSLALKGGTAINLTIFNLPRLSVDIDLDYTKNNSRDDMMTDREEITRVIKRYMSAEDYELSDRSKSVHSVDSFVCSYTNSGGTKDAIKIEINYSLRSHILDFVYRPIETLGILSESSVLSVAPIEIFASKTVALLSRTAARDLYDMSNLIKYDLFDEQESIMLRKCVLFYLTVTSEEIPDKFDFSPIQSLTFHRIRIDLMPVLRKKERFDLPAAQKRVTEYLTNILLLSNKEQEYLDSFKSGKYSPELLFDDVDILERVRNHPMAVWKMQNHN